MPETRSNIQFKPVENPFFTHLLSEPIRYGDNEIHEIAVRKPKGSDLYAYGSPIISDPTSGKEASINFPIAFALVSGLSGIPARVLEQANPAELIDLFWKVGSLFIPGWQHLLPAMMTLKDASSAPQEQPAS